MTPSELFDLFVGGQADTTDIVQLDLATATRQIHELRQDEPDDIQMSDEQIATAILDYAKAN